MAIKFGGASVEEIAEAREAQAGPPLLTPGWYDGTVYEVEAGEYKETSKNPGLPNLKVTLQTTVDGSSRKVFVTVPLEPVWRSNTSSKTLFLPFFEALGYDVAKGLDIDDESELLGKELSFKVTKSKSTYNGEERERNEVRAFKKAGFVFVVSGPAKSSKPAVDLDL